MQLRVLSAQALRPRARVAISVLIGLMMTATARADTFINVRYSAKKDELVITMAYRGTNPWHVFSLNWGPCRDSQPQDGHEVDAEILDSQPQDVEQQDFKKTTRFSLKDMPCRPARLTLRSAPRFVYTVNIPAKSGVTP